MAKGKSKKPKGYFLGGLFSGEQKQEPTQIEQPGYIKNLAPEFKRLLRTAVRTPAEEQVAGFSGDTQGAFDLYRQLATDDPTGYGQDLSFAKDTIRSAFDQNQPWDEKLVSATLQDYDYGADMDRARRARDQAGRGAFGDRAYIANAEADRVLNNDRAMLASKMREEGINRRTGAANALAGLAGQERSTAVQGAGLLEGVGTRQDTREQQVLDVPQKNAALWMPVFSQAPSATTQGVTTTNDSPFKTIAGLGLAGAGIAGMFKDGGQIKGAFADGGAVLSDAGKQAQMALARALRIGDPAGIAAARADLERQMQLDAGAERLDEVTGRGRGTTGKGATTQGAFSTAQADLARALREGDEGAAAQARARLRQTKVGPMSSDPEDDPRLLAAEQQRQGGGDAGSVRAPAGSFQEWWKRNFSEAREGLPMQRELDVATAAEESAFPRPMARPEMQGPPTPAGRVAQGPAPAQPQRSAFASPPMPQARPGRLTAEQSALIDDVIAPQPMPAGGEPAAADATASQQDRGAFGKWFANPLLLAGLATLASDDPDFTGAIGEGGLTAANMVAGLEDAESRRRLAEEEQRRRGAFDDFRRQQEQAEQDRWQKGYDLDVEQAKNRQKMSLAELDLERRKTDATIGATNALARQRSTAAQPDPNKGPQSVLVKKLYENLADLYADPYADPAQITQVLEAISAYEGGSMPAGGGGAVAPPAGFEVVP